MKRVTTIFVTIAILLTISGCSNRQLKKEIILPNYNHSMSGKLRYQRKLKKIKEEEKS